MQLGGHLVRAIAWMGGTLVSFTAMAISVRELSSGMHAFEMLFIRSAIGVAVLTPIVWAAGWRTLATKRLAGHVLRNGVHFTGQVLWIFGIALLPPDVNRSEAVFSVERQEDGSHAIRYALGAIKGGGPAGRRRHEAGRGCRPAGRRRRRGSGSPIAACS